MKFSMRLVTLGLVLGFGAGQEAWAAQQKEEDSVYQWGRWAVLSPAAGGETYQESVTPDAANNARPGEAAEFQPVVASVGPSIPPIGTAPGVVPVDPGQPIINLPPPPPPGSSTVGVVPIDPGQPVVNLPSPPPPPP